MHKVPGRPTSGHQDLYAPHTTPPYGRNPTTLAPTQHATSTTAYRPFVLTNQRYLGYMSRSWSGASSTRFFSMSHLCRRRVHWHGQSVCNHFPGSSLSCRHGFLLELGTAFWRPFPSSPRQIDMDGKHTPQQEYCLLRLVPIRGLLTLVASAQHNQLNAIRSRCRSVHAATSGSALIKSMVDTCMIGAYMRAVSQSTVARVQYWIHHAAASRSTV
ncbi:hypothetical protein B0T25DRAFT_295640 [Lasiosphaeria hispida]|uniref:Uncharacterized protein n=1 Tax=Lasiosphaeria hispida TaxID=260671 RepID=A0AAJ0HCU1_9PEZI|nr:hypothetical protein B0T25DRAFT_295640 [Lasiosphaeria hispida]